MDELKYIREKISLCDDKIIDALAERMDYIKDIVEYKKKNGMPILQPEQEKQQVTLKAKLKDNTFEEEIMDIYTNILNNSKKIQAKSLFDYNIFLIGFMGSGKTTVSAYLSKMFAMEDIETDQMIIKREGMSIKEIFEKKGEEYFRNCESNVLMELQKKNRMVVSCGGGIVLRDDNIRTMKTHGRVVFLTAAPETVYERVKGSNERPLLNDDMSVEFISSLMKKREERYKNAADITVSTDDKSINEICEELIGKLVEFDTLNMDVCR